MKYFFIGLLFIINTTNGQGGRVDTIAFESKANLLVFKGKLNGNETNFAFDTGASVGVLTNKQAKVSDVVVNKKTKVTDSNHKKTAIKIATVDEISVGSFDVEKTKNGIFDMPYLACNDLFLLGGNVINQLNWKIDFEKSVLYVSKEEFDTSDSMTPIDVRIINERHFCDIKIENSESLNCLIDFGFAGFFEGSAEDKFFIDLKSKKGDEVVPASSYTMGLTSNSNKNTAFFKVNSLQLANKNMQDIQVEVQENTSTKLGFEFFRTMASSIIIHPKQKKYYIEFSNKRPNLTLPFDANVYFNNKKLVVSSKVNNDKSSASALEIGQEVKAINHKRAADFKDECEFIRFMISYQNLNEILITKMNDESVLIKKQTLE